MIHVALTLLLVAADWPQFRGPAGDGHANAQPPLTWSESDNVAWKAAIHGKAWSSPVVLGDQVWVTTASEDGKELFAVGLDRKSGRVLHDVRVTEVNKPQFCHPYNSYASPTPVIETGRLYVHFGSPFTGCIDTSTGRVFWERHDLKCNHWRGAGSSPVVHGDLLILTFDGYDRQYVAALDKRTGRTVWSTDRAISYSTDDGDFKKAYSTPLVIEQKGRVVIVSPSAEATIAYDIADGKEIWRVRHGGMNAAARPVVGDDRIFLTSGHTKYLLAVPVGGAGDMTSRVEWKLPRGPSRPSLLFFDRWLFCVNDEGIASCLEGATGRRVWQERLGGAFSASPVLAGGCIYFAGENGTIYVVKAGPRFELVASNKLDAGCMASPAVVGEAIYLRTKTHVYCIGKP